jgi:hypothetical protein
MEKRHLSEGSSSSTVPDTYYLSDSRQVSKIGDESILRSSKTESSDIE